MKQELSFSGTTFLSNNPDKDTLGSLDIRELIEVVNYSLCKGVVLPVTELVGRGLDEIVAQDFEGYEGKPCYFLIDNVTGNIRDVYVCNKFTRQHTAQVLEELDTYIFDLIYMDIVNEFIQDNEVQKKLISEQDYMQLYKYITQHDLNISKWELGWVQVLAEYKLELIKEFVD